MYNKIFTKILDSSVWLEPSDTRLVWLTLIAAMDEDGFAPFASVANLAHRARVPLDATETAVHTLEEPDPNSSDPDNDGRRIERVPGGWMVLNAPKYKELVTRHVAREQVRERVKRHRDRKRSSVTGVTCIESVTQSDTETETTSKTEGNTTAAASRGPAAEPAEFVHLRAIYPKRAGSQPWNRALKAARARIREGSTWDEILEGVRRYARWATDTGKIGTETVMQAATFCGPDRHYLQDWVPPISKGGQRLSRNLAAAEEFLRGTEP